MADGNGKFNPQQKNPGDLILSADWNDAMQAIVALGEQKINRKGVDSLQGPLTIEAALQVQGKLGIGTTTPEAGLDVRSTLKAIKNEDTLTALRIKPTFNDDGKQNVKHYGLIVEDGNVGIGTANPQAQLTVSSLAGTQIQVDGYGGQYGLYLGADSSHPWIGSKSNHDLRIITNSSEKIRVKADGNLGIGTTEPKSMLQIGDGLASGGGYRTWMTRGTQVAWDTDNVFLGLKDEGSNRKDAVIAWGDDSDDAFRFIFASARGATEDKEIIRLLSSGNVGIGITNPGAKLEVACDSGLAIKVNPADNKSVYIGRDDKGSNALVFNDGIGQSLASSDNLSFNINSLSSSVLKFDGSDDYVSVPAGNWFDGNFTIEAWVYVREAKSSSRLLDFGNGQANDNVVIALSDGTSGKVSVEVYVFATSQGKVTTPDKLPLNQWVHLACVGQRDEILRITLYKNGEVWTTGNTAIRSVNRTNNYIGRSNSTQDAYAPFSISEFRFWKTARTPEQIRQFMNRRLVGNEERLLGYWRFDEKGSPTTAIDYSSKKQNATINGAVGDDSSFPPLNVIDFRSGSASSSNPPIVRIQGNGNVGIGTNNPSQKITIQADYSATDDAKQLLIQGNTNTNNQLEIGYHTTNNYGSIQAITQGAETRNLALNPVGGNVGIGITKPGAKLEVACDSGLAIKVNPAANKSVYIGRDDQGTNALVFNDGIGQTLASSDSLSFNINSFASVLKFNGIGDYANISEVTRFDTSFTVEAWVYVREIKSWSRLLDFGNGRASNNIVIALSNGTSGQVTVEVYQGATSGGKVTTPDALPLNQWVHLVFVCIIAINNTNATLSVTIYKNANVWATGNTAIPINVSRTNNYIGRSNWGDAYAAFSISEFRIWNTARTLEQIRQFMNTRLVGNEAGLIGYWRFDKVEIGTDSSRFVKDYSPSQKNATLTGAVGDDSSFPPLNVIDFRSGSASSSNPPIVRIQGNGNVGIGTTSPNAKLTIQTPDLYGGNTIRFEAKQQPSLYYLNLNTSVTDGVVRWVFDQKNNTTSHANVLAFDRGNIGIGTNNPRAKLEISGTLRATKVNDILTALHISSTFDDSDSNTAGTIFSNVNHYGLIVENGNVGIGTTAPKSMLQIGSEVSGAGYRDWMVRGTLVGWDTDNVYFGLKDQGSNRKDAVIAWGDDTTDVFRFIFTDSTGASNDKDIMKLQPNGNVYVNGVLLGNGGDSNGAVLREMYGTASIAFDYSGSIDIYSDQGTNQWKKIKTFAINHPCDDSKYLIHGTLEGPEAGVYYRGTAQLVNGKAEITLPDYFEALTRTQGRTITLTNINGFDRLMVKTIGKDKIVDGKFFIISDNPNSSQEFDWEVKAIRKDVSPLVVELDKKDFEIKGIGPYTYTIPKQQ